jgi:hypothetical protein
LREHRVGLARDVVHKLRAAPVAPRHGDRIKRGTASGMLPQRVA